MMGMAKILKQGNAACAGDIRPEGSPLVCLVFWIFINVIAGSRRIGF